MLILKKGTKSEDVKRLQHLLNFKLKPCPNLTLDGDFGKSTYEAVVFYQKLNGLNSDGIVGIQLGGFYSKCL